MSEQQPAVIVKDLYKTFKLPHDQHSGLKQLIVNFYKRDKGYETQQVLNGISFEIKKGEFFGIVGRNGSGKSTLLKLLAGIYTPDKGLVQVNGSLTPFIELGVGFNPELTGRENVFLNGALLGFSRKEMELMYGEIVDFAELEKFMDQKLKNYSSGMQVRLAFSIAIRARSEILLLDEVLAVGDEAFQRKCYDYFDDLRRNKKTVILVTHDMAAIERFCSRALFIENGEIVSIGKPHLISAAYTKSNRVTEKIETESVENSHKENPSNIIVKTLGVDNLEKTIFNCGDNLIVDIDWSKLNGGGKNVGVAIIKKSGEYIFGTNTFIDEAKTITKTRARYQVKLNLTEGAYFMKVGVFGSRPTDVIDFLEEGPEVRVLRNAEDPRWHGITQLEHKWETE